MCNVFDMHIFFIINITQYFLYFVFGILLYDFYIIYQSKLKNAIKMFSDIETRTESRPKIGIFGDLYVRDNDIMNQDLVHFIEDILVG